MFLLPQLPPKSPTELVSIEMMSMRKMYEYTCPECGHSFKDWHRGRKFCSYHCELVHWHRVKPELYFCGTKNSFEITLESKRYIDGLLLGDASIPKPSTKSGWSALLNQEFSIKFIEWAEQVKEKLENFGITLSPLPPRKRLLRGKRYETVSLQTHSYPEFNSFRKRWYPNGKKEVPRDIDFNEATFSNWYLGDGCLSVTRQGCHLYLSTEGFDNESLEFLRLKMKEYGLLFKRSKGRLYLSDKESIRLFLSHIADVPDCFNHKVIHFDS